MRIHTSKFAILAIVLSATLAQAQTPRLYHYEGELKTEDATPFNGTTNLTFNIYKTPVADKPVWSEEHHGIKVTDGSYSVLLGSKNPLKLSFYEYYIEATPESGQDSPHRVMIVGSGYNYRLWFLFAAYTIVWVAIFAYVLSIKKRQGKITAEIKALTQEVV